MAEQSHKNWLSIMIKTLVVLMIVLLLVVVILHIPSVQKKIALVAANQVVDASQGDLTFESATFDLHKGVTIKDLALRDNRADTLLTVGKIGITPRSTLLSLISEVSFNDVNITGVAINVRRNHGEELSNWQRFISEFQSSEREAEPGESKAFPLTHFELYDLELNYHDEVDSLFMIGQFAALETKIDLIKDGQVKIDFINLIEPSFDVKGAMKDKGSQPSERDESVSGKESLIELSQLNILNGTIAYKADQTIKANNVDLVMSDVKFMDTKNWQAVIRDISLETDGYDIKHVSSSRIISSPENIKVSDFFARVNNSYIKAELSAENIYDITGINDLSIDLDLSESKIVPKDFVRLIDNLSPELLAEPLMNKRHQVIGHVDLRNGQFNLNDLKLWLNGSHYLHANGTMSGISDLDNGLINLEVISLQSDLERLDRDINLLDIPDEVKRMGKLQFSGTFDGFANDFIAQGALDTELGRADMDIQFDLYRSNPEEIGYDGFLELTEFDLAEMLQQEDFGPVSLSVDINNGQGLAFASSNAQIEAVIDQFIYRDVIYESAVYRGTLSSKVIDGDFLIEDPNLDLAFSGLIDFSGAEPILDFDMQAGKIDFCKLNLISYPCELSFEAEVDFFGKSFSTLQGTGLIKDIVIHHDTSTLAINEIALSSRRMTDQATSFNLTSDIFDVAVEGKFNLTKLHENLIGQIFENHEEHLSLLNLSMPYEGFREEVYTVELVTRDVEPLMDFLNQDIEIAPGTKLTAQSNKNNDKSIVTINSDTLRYGDYLAQDLYLNVDSRTNYGEVELQIDQLMQGDREIDKVSWVGHLRGKELYSKALINVDDRNHFELETKSKIVDEGYFTQFLYDDIVVDSTLWTILPNKGIGYNKKSIDIENFILTDGRRAVGIKDIYKRGLEVSLREFDLDVINPIIDYDKLTFTGTVDAQLKLNNIFEQLAVEGYVQVPDFKINDADYGNLSIESKRRDGNILDVALAITKDNQNLYVTGIADIDKQSLNTHLTMEDYPLAFLEYIIQDGISETEGLVDIELDISGPFNDIKMDGYGFAYDGGTKIDYIGAYYQLSSDSIPITERFIDLNNIVLTDEAGNTAELIGGLRHNVLADFRSDIEVKSDNFIALNTTADDNPLYYGLGMGPVEVSFKGPFDRIDMNVDAVAGPNSLLYIPINSTDYGYDESFINFNFNQEVVDSNTVDQLVERLTSSGLDFEMNLTFDRDAEVQIIYDEETSNVLIGHGEGDLQIKVKRDGEFSVYGQYDVESGEYLYTSYGFIAKPFIIEQGGTVTWTGDPVNAVLDVQAFYPSLRAPLQRFLQEYEGVYPDVTDSELRQRRNIGLDLILTGNLFNPDINFDIGFPDLVGNLRNLADSKVRALKATENGINNQVLGLMVFNNFVPDNDPLANIQVSNVAQVTGNTITEFLTSQLSLLATEYLSELLEGDVITGIDLDIALAQNNTIGDNNVSDPDASFVEFVPDEVQLNLRNEFKNDNFVLNIGGNYVRENPLNTVNDYLTGDFSLDWFITKDKRLKLQIYGVYDLDEASLGRRQIYGFGINYTREFGKMTYSSIEEAFDDVNNEILNGQQSSAGTR